MLEEALRRQEFETPQIHARAEELFSRIFVDYPGGLHDRSVGYPRDAQKYIDKWHELASMRKLVTKDAAEAEDGNRLDSHLIDKLFDIFKDTKLMSDLRPKQQGKSPDHYRRCTESKLFKEAGHKHVAYAIWEIGLPRLPPFATEQRNMKLSEQDLEAVPQAIQHVLRWLDIVASSLKQHEDTAAYLTAKRKAGSAHRVSGLTVAEREANTALEKAREDLRMAQRLQKQWNAKTLTDRNVHWWQYDLLRKFWNRELSTRLEELKKQHSVVPKCRKPRF